MFLLLFLFCFERPRNKRFSREIFTRDILRENFATFERPQIERFSRFSQFSQFSFCTFSFAQNGLGGQNLTVLCCWLVGRELYAHFGPKNSEIDTLFTYL